MLKSCPLKHPLTGGVWGYKMNRFSQQFMKFPKLLKFGPLKHNIQCIETRPSWQLVCKYYSM